MVDKLGDKFIFDNKSYERVRSGQISFSKIAAGHFFYLRGKYANLSVLSPNLFKIYSNWN